jgi:hypothetical protein
VSYNIRKTGTAAEKAAVLLFAMASGRAEAAQSVLLTGWSAAKERP